MFGRMSFARLSDGKSRLLWACEQLVKSFALGTNQVTTPSQGLAAWQSLKSPIFVRSRISQPLEAPKTQGSTALTQPRDTRDRNEALIVNKRRYHRPQAPGITCE